MMNSEQVISLYETMSELTGQMLLAAQSRDWENLAELESHCASHVRSLKQGEPVAALSGANRARKVEIIHQILAHDRQIRDLTEPWMAELSALINSTSTERKLSMAYGAQQAG
jgi:flagellar protein FliT